MRFKITRAVLGAFVATAACVGVALLSTSPASAATSPCSDADSFTNMPTGPTTVSTAVTPQFGKVLVIGSGAYLLFTVPLDLRSASLRHRCAVRV